MRCRKLFIVFILILALIPFSLAQEVPLYIFYGQGCPHCERAMDFLSEMSEKYPELDVVMYEVYFNDGNRELFMHYCSEVEQSAQGVPTIFIDDKTFVGFNNEIAFQIEEEIKRCLSEGCEDISEKCSLNGHLKGDFDPVNPMSGSYHSIVGWVFIFAIIAAAAFMVIKRLIKK